MAGTLTQGEQDAIAVARIYQATGNNATLYASTLQSYYADPSRLESLLSSVSDPSFSDAFNIGLQQIETDIQPATDAIGAAIKRVTDAAKNATATVGVVQVAFIGIAAFALYKIFTSETGIQTVREIVRR